MRLADWSRSVKVLLAAALFAALAVGAVAAVLLAWDSRNDDVPATAPPVPLATTPDDPSPADPGTTVGDVAPAAELPDGEAWPTFGQGRGRTGFARDVELAPPFDEVWSVDGESLLRFPPVVAYGHVFAATSLGRVMALDAESGDVLWESETDRCTAASPAVMGKVVFVSLMDPTPCDRHERRAPGYLVAFDAATGDELWRFEAGVIESSPLVVGKRVFVGSWDNNVYALDLETGDQLWSYETEDRIRGGAAFRQNRVYISGDDDTLYALAARNGQLIWAAQGGDNFRTTPAINSGRVYIGNADGNVYAFGADEGETLWTYATGGPVFGTPAIWEDTVYVGSATGRLYALDAATGGVNWSFDAASPIAGSPTVVAGHVYVSTQAKKTFALDALTGTEVWSFDDGRRSSLVADDSRVYLSGSRILYALEPTLEEAGLGQGDDVGEGVTPPEGPVGDPDAGTDPGVGDPGAETEPGIGDPDDTISELEPIGDEPAPAPPNEASPVEPDSPAGSGTAP